MNALRLHMSDTNACILNDYIKKSVTTDEEYKRLVYDTIGELLSCNNIEKKLRDIYDLRIFWFNDMYKEFRDLEFNIDFPPKIDIEEGVLQCIKCGSKKTISFQRQTRSADEGMTTYAQCVECNNRWKNNN